MAKLLSDDKYAVNGRLVAVDNGGMIGPMFTLRVPPNTFDLQRPGSYMDFILLDTHRKTLKKRFHVDDELQVIIHASAAGLQKGTRDEKTFYPRPPGRAQRINHCRREFSGASPVNGKVIDNDGRNTIIVEAGAPIALTLLDYTPASTKKVKVNSWVTFWPAPPTHGIILGKV